MLDQAESPMYDLQFELRSNEPYCRYTDHMQFVIANVKDRLRMEEAQHLCTKVGIIDGGKLVTEDTPTGLIAAHPGCEDLESVYLRLTGRKLRNMED